MQLTLELTPTQGALPKALSPRGAARKGDYLQKTARDLLVSAMRRESRLRRISWDEVATVALTEAVEKRKQQA